MDNKNQQPKATVKKNSLVRELLGYAIKNEIEPKSKELMRNVITGTFNMLNEAATKSVDRWIYPEGDAPARKSNNQSIQKTNYSTRVYSTTKNESRPPKETTYSRSSTEVQLVWCDDEEDAKEIVTTLLEEIDNYKKAKVATYYETVSRVCRVHIPITFPDNKYGWTENERNGIGYYQDRGKFFIDLPKPVNVENI